MSAPSFAVCGRTSHVRAQRSDQFQKITFSVKLCHSRKKLTFSFSGSFINISVAIKNVTILITPFHPHRPFPVRVKSGAKCHQVDVLQFIIQALLKNK